MTVDNADEIRDFYTNVVGWKPGPVEMDGYNDYNMCGEDGEAIAGVCYRRGVNEKLPPQWLIYITVRDVNASAQRCVELGGKIIDGPRPMGKQRFCVIQDPAGAVVGLISE